MTENIKSFNDLVVFMKEQKDQFELPDTSKLTTIPRLFQQFQQLNLPPQARDRAEVMVVFGTVEETVDELEMTVQNLWFNKESGDVVDEPEWFIERKKILAKAKEKELENEQTKENVRD